MLYAILPLLVMILPVHTMNGVNPFWNKEIEEEWAKLPKGFQRAVTISTDSKNEAESSQEKGKAPQKAIDPTEQGKAKKTVQWPDSMKQPEVDNTSTEGFKHQRRRFEDYEAVQVSEGLEEVYAELHRVGNVRRDLRTLTKNQWHDRYELATYSSHPLAVTSDSTEAKPKPLAMTAFASDVRYTHFKKPHPADEVDAEGLTPAQRRRNARSDRQVRGDESKKRGTASKAKDAKGE